MRGRVIAGVAIAIGVAGVGLACGTLDAGTDGPAGGGLDAGLEATGDGAPDGTPCTIPVETDPHNCGQCGHDCLGGACVAAKCGPVSLGAVVAPWYLAQDKTDLFVTSKTAGGGLHRVSKSGGVALVISQALFGVAVDATTVYSCDATTSTLYVTEKAGGATTLFTIAAPCIELADDDGGVYFTMPGPGLIALRDADGGMHTVAAGLDGGLEGIAIDGDTVFASEGARGTIVAAPRAVTDGVAKPLATPGGQPRRLAVSEGWVYWVSYATKTVLRAPASGGATETVAMGTGDTSSGGIAVDATHVYWVEPTLGRVLKKAKNGGPDDPEVVFDHLNDPIDVAVDEAAIYVTVQGAGQVLKLAK